MGLAILPSLIVDVFKKSPFAENAKGDSPLTVKQPVPQCAEGML